MSWASGYLLGIPIYAEHKYLMHRLCRNESLYLDPQIRDWVLFPITIVMVRSIAGLLVLSPDG